MLAADTPRGRLAIALGIYLLVTAACFAAMPRGRALSHSPFNHYALQADAWLHGRLDLGGPPPRYTANNDFAVYRGKHYVSFPPLPAVILVPFVAAAGSVERVRGPVIFGCLAGVAPALLFLAMAALRRARRLRRSLSTCATLAVLFALGTVYWFSAVQGSVWFAAHVVAAALSCGYLLCCIEARHPALAGLLLGLAFATRPTVALALPVFAYELWRQRWLLPAARRDRAHGEGRAATLWRPAAAFALPFAAMVLAVGLYNWMRFDSVTEFGHRLLTVAWRRRIATWGLFSPHYLGRNLGVMLSSMPFYTPERGLQINGHGLALWLTSPFYLWALWPRRPRGLYWALALATGAMTLAVLLYQNSGWVQFGYRFSNDFAPLLVLMIALGRRRLGPAFSALALWAVVVNSYGAASFGNPRYAHRYFIDGSQRIIYQPD